MNDFKLRLSCLYTLIRFGIDYFLKIFKLKRKLIDKPDKLPIAIASNCLSEKKL